MNHAVIITGRRLKLDGSPEASSSLHLQGGPMNTELRRKLRRRRNLEDHRAREKRQQTKRRSEWVLDLNNFRFDKRESIIAFE